MDVLERQSLSELKMGRGSPICERVRKKLWNTLKTMYLNVKLQRLCNLMAWGCISAYGMGSLHVLEGTMNAEMYIKLLE